MKELLTPPRTIMQVFKALPEGTLAEVIENKLYMSPAPSPFHQEISIAISTVLNLFVRKNKLGKVFYAPIDLYLDEQMNAVQPDILFISAANSLTVDRDGLHGVPDLIVEILSPGNKVHDQVKKKELYEKHQVMEYWMVDPETKEAEGFTYQEGVFHPLGKFQSEIPSKLLNECFEY